jgi:DNA-binding NtrC family response regulator
MKSGMVQPVCSGETERVEKALKREFGLRDIVGRSAAIRAQIAQARRFARSDAPVLIVGETGTGKEVFARAIHYDGLGSGRRFMPVNCGALPVELVENELFGHESEAFSGARRSHQGLIEQAEGGTVFLDEIGTLPLPAQTKLLRFLQDHKYRPLGGNRDRTADVRIISASNADLACANKFRQDLYYRLNVLTLNLPALRERREDVPILAQHLLQHQCQRLGQTGREFSAAALDKLLGHNWPGNVRELENVIRQAIALSDRKTIEERDLVLPVTARAFRGRSFEAFQAPPIGRPRKVSAEDLLAVLGNQELGRQEWFERVQQAGNRVTLRTFDRRRAELQGAGKIVYDHERNRQTLMAHTLIPTRPVTSVHP